MDGFEPTQPRHRIYSPITFLHNASTPRQDLLPQAAPWYPSPDLNREAWATHFECAASTVPPEGRTGAWCCGWNGGLTGSRTPLDGFAVRHVTAPTSGRQVRCLRAKKNPVALGAGSGISLVGDLYDRKGEETDDPTQGVYEDDDKRQEPFVRTFVEMIEVVVIVVLSSRVSVRGSPVDLRVRSSDMISSEPKVNSIRP
jgi:hypothetical protein